jgi:hypothetical protein
LKPVLVQVNGAGNPLPAYATAATTLDPHTDATRTTAFLEGAESGLPLFKFRNNAQLAAQLAASIKPRDFKWA